MTKRFSIMLILGYVSWLQMPSFFHNVAIAGGLCREFPSCGGRYLVGLQPQLDICCSVGYTGASAVIRCDERSFYSIRLLLVLFEEFLGRIWSDLRILRLNVIGRSWYVNHWPVSQVRLSGVSMVSRI
jgi:hypothetical protein